MRSTPSFPVAVLIVAAASLLTVGCGDSSFQDDDVSVRTGAVYPASKMTMFVPAYYYDSNNSNWDNLINTVAAYPAPFKFVVVNGPNSGPPATWTSTMDNHIRTLFQYHVIVLGYVNLGTPGHDGAVAADAAVTQWKNLFADGGHGMSGIYFDVAGRTDLGDMGRYEYLAARVTNEFQYVGQTMCTPGGCFPIYYPGFPAFGWGTAPSYPTQNYFECVQRKTGNSSRNIWLTLEQRAVLGAPANFVDGYYDDLFNGDWGWIKNYRSDHFVNLAHTFNPPTDFMHADLIARKVRQRGAVGMYVTDCQDSKLGDPRVRSCSGGEWGESPNLTLLQHEFYEASQTYSDYTGGNSDPYLLPDNCPPPAL
jgi:hypothetical protein